MAELPEPAAWMWQHDETGMVGFLQDGPAEDRVVWERMNKPRKIIGPIYTADQLRAAIQAETERCAKIADAERDEHLPSAAQNNGRSSDFAFGSVNSAERIAAGIRGQAEGRE